jgi:hypothetical protein
MLSFGRAMTLIAHERASLLSSGSKERGMSILEGAEGIIVYRFGFQLFSCMSTLDDHGRKNTRTVGLRICRGQKTA